jgi:phosphatidylserine/phosphatidylglycerophosphate/cardiolipin synthase-like enzyme
MNPECLLQHFERISEAPNVIPRLRWFISDLAVRGKLVEQDLNDEPAAELLGWVHAEQRRLASQNKNRMSGDPSYARTAEYLFRVPATWKWVHWESILAFDEGAFKRGPFGSALTKGIFVASGYTDRVFVHGKAGVIEAADGSKTCLLGSINETKRAFVQNYEILWEDTSPEGVTWMEEEFEALWQDAFPLPDAIIEEIKRVADRVEMRFEEVTPDELPAAALAESPIYRGGEQLQPW